MPKRRVSHSYSTANNYYTKRRPAKRQRTTSNRRTGGYVGLEKKFKDYDLLAQATSPTWAGSELDPTGIGCLSAVAQGDGESERDGRVYQIHSLHIKGWIETQAVESDTNPMDDFMTRLVLVQDTQTNGAQLNGEDVIDTVSSVYDINGFRNLQYSTRFKVLKDKMLRTTGANTAMNEGAPNLFSNGSVRIPFSFNKRFKKPITVRCSSTTATVAAVTDNSLHLIGVTRSGTTVPTISYRSRIRFTG